MRLKMSENSLFAILLRSKWWISLLVVAVIVLASGAFLPAPYVPFGVMGALPFLVISVMVAWRQRHAPDPARLDALLQGISTMSWSDFSSRMKRAFDHQGYAVTPLRHPVVDFKLVKGTHITLVACRRWKAANLGVQALRDLAAAQTALGAQASTLVSLATVSDSASRFAKAQGIHLMSVNELAQLLSD